MDGKRSRAGKCIDRGEITDFYAKLERIDRESGGFRQESNSRWNVLSLM
jgi:hypothetical protein